MEVHVVTCLNEHFYQREVEQDQRHRHRIFVDQMGWEALRQVDGRERDAYDAADTTHLLLLRDEDVIGGLRLTPLDRPNLLLSHFDKMLQRPLPGSLREGADWTRFYVTDRQQRLGPSSAAGALYCSAMEYALAKGWNYLTFVSKPAMIEILVSIGWTVMPLGMPKMIDGELAVAASIRVDGASLERARQIMGLPRSLLRARSALGDAGTMTWTLPSGGDIVH